MDFERTDEQDEISALARRILGDRVTEDLLRKVEAAEGERFDRATWEALAEAGLLGVAVPEAQGGLGLGIIEQCLVLTEVGRTIAPVPVLAAIVGGVLPVAEFGDPDQQARWVEPGIAGTTLLAPALVEPRNRRPDQPATTATADGDGWVLAGAKTCVPAGTMADGFLVPATTADGRVVVALVDADADGLDIEPQRVTNRDTEALLTLDGVRVAPGDVLGSADDGRTILDWVVERTTVGLAAQVAGVVAKALELTAAYTKERVQFDRPIATFQAVGQRAADAYIDVQATELVWLQAAWKLAEGLPAATDVEVAGYWAAESAHRVAHTAVHLHGGTGVDADHPIHRYFLAAKALEFTLGGATDQLLRIGATMAAVRE